MIAPLHVRRVGIKVLAVLLAGMVSLSASGFAHNGWDDGACDPIPTHHNHSAHRLQSGKLPTGAQDHCLFCHSLRSLGNGLVAVHVFAADTADTTTIRASVVGISERPLDPSAPSRAPPTVLL